MKQYLFILLFILTGIMGVSCSETNEPESPDKGLLSFTLKVGNKGYQAVIHPDTHEVTIGGIEYASTITNISYQLSSGASISPEPATRLESWGKEEVFTISLPDGENIDYRIILNDYKGYEPEGAKSEGLVIGYIMADEYASQKSMIRWEYLTHVIVSFLYVHEDGTMDESTVNPCIAEIVKTAHEHNVKVLVSLQSDALNGFAQAVQTPVSRTKLVNDAISFARKHGVDGIDIDYELYSFIGPNVLAFVQELYAQKGDDLLQTCAVAQWDAGYTTEWHRSFDYINLMTYDNTGHWGAEGQHSSYEQALDGVRKWNTDLQAPLSKLVLGLPFYGYTWDTFDGWVTPTAVRYSQIFALYPNANVANLDQVGRTYYNGKPTIQRKCRYVKDTGLAGVMIWQLFQDTNSPETSLMQVIGDEMSELNRSNR